MRTKTEGPQVTKFGAIDVQACVPADFTDEQIVVFAEEEYPSGTGGWQIRRQGGRLLNGADERVSCNSRDGCVHIMLDA